MTENDIKESFTKIIPFLVDKFRVPLSNPYVLCHGTSIEFLKSILENGALIASPGDPPITIRGHTEILNKGVFTQLILNCDKELNMTDTELCNKEVLLIFNLDLLKLPFHITNSWAGGVQVSPLIESKVGPVLLNGSRLKTYNTIDAYIQDNASYLCKGTHQRNEVVFQENVPLSYLKEIWICNHEELTTTVNDRNEKGRTTKRTKKTIKIDPGKNKTEVETLLEEHHIDVPVKIINNISGGYTSKYSVRST